MSKHRNRLVNRVMIFLRMDAEHAVEGVGGLMYERFRVVQIGMEVFEGQVAVVTGFVECLDHRRPVGGAVEERAKGFQRMVGPFLGEFLEVDVLDTFA